MVIPEVLQVDRILTVGHTTPNSAPKEAAEVEVRQIGGHVPVAEVVGVAWG
jgi:hypothetical protein